MTQITSVKAGTATGWRVQGMVRNAIAPVLSIPLIPMIADHLGSEQLSLGLIAALLLKEVTVGLVVGLVLSVPLYAAEGAGDIVDCYAGPRRPA